MTEPKPCYHVATGWQLRPQSVKVLRKAAKQGMSAWRTIAQATIDELRAATRAIKAHETSAGEIRQRIADETGNGESTIRAWQALEEFWCDQLDELPQDAVLTWSQLRWFKVIAKREGKNPHDVFIELTDDAISRRDRENCEAGENILFTSEAVLKHRARGDKVEPAPSEYLARAVNCIAQYVKRSENNNGLTVKANEIAAALEDLLKKAEKVK